MSTKNKSKSASAAAPAGDKTKAAASSRSSVAAAAAQPAQPAAASAAAAAPKMKQPHKPAAGSKAAQSFVASAPASSTPAPPAAARSALVGAIDDDDAAPLVRGSAAPRKAAAATAAASAVPLPSDAPAKAEDVLFGKKRSEKEEAAKAKAAAGKKRKTGDVSADGQKKKSRGAGDEEEQMDLFTGSTVAATLKNLSDPLSHSSLKPGMLLLGAVRAVNEVDLTVQLPHGLTGYVSMREVSDTIAAIVDKYIEAGEKAEEAAASGKAPSADEDAAAPINLPNLAEFVQVGQLVYCTILSVGENAKDAAVAAATSSAGSAVSAHKSRRIEISLRAALFNQNLSLQSLHEGRLLYGSVKSVQEKGYVVDVGISSNNAAATSSTAAAADNITAFLPFSAAPADMLLPAAKKTGRPQLKKEGEESASSSSSSSRRLCVGMPITTVITSAQNKRVLLLTADPALVSAAVTRNSASAQSDDSADGATALKNSIGFTNLQPGMLVRAEIVSVISAEQQAKTNAKMSGLYVRFLDFFHGVVDNLHSSSDASIAGSLESLFHVGQKVSARILHINFIGKRIALSLLPHIVSLDRFSFPASVKPGDRIPDSIITKVEPKMGVYLRLPVSMAGANTLTKERAAKMAQAAEKKAAAKAAKKAAKKKDAEGDEAMDHDDDEDSDDDEDDDEAEEDDEEDVSEELSLSAWAHLSRLSDSHITHVPKNMQSIGSTVGCRILNLHYLDGQVHVSTQPHIMEQSILYYEDVRAGMEVQGEIVSVESFGVLLKLTPHITALIPTLQLSDIVLSDPSKKFKVGSALKARVLYCEEKSKKIICTLKKGLLSSALPQLSEYSAAKPGLISHGYIASIQDYGLIVEFYNQVHGLVPVADLRASGFLKPEQTPEQVFKRGEVHKTRVVSCDAKRRRMQLSLGLVASAVKIEGVASSTAEGDASIDEIAAPGRIVSGAVKEVKKDGLIIALAAEEAEAGKKGKKKAAAASAAKVEHLVFLPASQLTDHPSLVEGLLRAFPVGSVFAKLLVLHKDKALRMPIVSAKPSLLHVVAPVAPTLVAKTGAAAKAAAAESLYTLPSSYDTLQPGMLLLGFVKAIMDYGLFVSFLDGVTALAPRSMLADRFLEGDLAAAFSVGQTVKAKVVSVETKEGEAQPRLNVTLRPSQLSEGEAASDLETDGAFAVSFFAESARIATALSGASSEAAAAVWDRFPLGGAFQGTVKAIQNAMLELSPDAAAVAAGVQAGAARPYQTGEPASKKELLAASSSANASISTESGEKYAPGQSVTGRILDVDRVKKIVDVSLRAEIVSPAAAAEDSAAAAAKGGKNKRKSTTAATVGSSVSSLVRGAEVSVKVQLVRNVHLVLSLPAHSQAIGYALACSFNSRYNPHSLFSCGQEMRARVVTAPKKAGDRLVLVIDVDAALAAYVKSKGGKGAAGAAAASGITFVDPALSKLSHLQNGVTLSVRIKGLSGGADASTAGPNTRLEVEIGTMHSRPITARVHVSELEDALHEQGAAGKAIAKAHASKPYRPLQAWAARVGETVQARIMQIVRKSATKSASASSKRMHISSIEVSLRPSVIQRETDEDDAAQLESGALHPAALSSLAVSDLAVNSVVQVIVKDVEASATKGESMLWVVVAPGIKGRLRCNELSFPAGDAAAQKQLKDLAASFKSGQALTAQVLDVHAESKLVDLMLLPLGSAKPRTIDPAVLERVKVAHAAAAAAHELRAGSVVTNLTVKRIMPGVGLLVSFASRHHEHGSASADDSASSRHEKLGRIHITDLSDKWSRSPLDSFKVGQTLKAAYVLGVIKKEEVFRGAEADMSDEDGEERKAAGSGPVHQQVDLSLRRSRLAPKKPVAGAAVVQPKYPEVTSFESLIGREGQRVQGYVKATSKAGCFISLSHDIEARCLLKNLSDMYVSDISKHFPSGKFLPRVRILSVDQDKRMVEVSLRKNDGPKGSSGDASESVGADGQPRYTFDALSVGDIVTGFVTQIKPFGVFVKLAQSSLSGLCHISEVSDARIADLSKHYAIGDKVRAKVVKLDEQTKKVSLGLKAKYFEGMEPASDAEDEADADEEAGDSDEEDAEEAAAGSDDEEQAPELNIEEDEDDAPAAKPAKKQSKKQKAAAAAAAAEAESSEEEEEVEMDDSRPSKKARASAAAASAAAASSASAIPALPADDGEMADAPALDLNSSFSMLTGSRHSSAPAAEDDDAPDSDDDEDDAAALDDDATGTSAAKKKSRRAKGAAKKAEERELLAREQSILDPTSQPESADDFERLIVQEPNSSMLWIKFMAYQISLTEIEKARKIGERALKAISFRQPAEKLNVWIALLNLENMYGSAASIKDTFTRAAQYNEPLTVYMEMAKIYAATNKMESCIETYESALRKFHGAPSIWLAYASCLYAHPAYVSAARDLLKRALSRTDKSDHISLMVKFAQLEFNVAHNVDRGRTILEGVMSSYPKRVDLWNIYLDMEIKIVKKALAAQAEAATPVLSVAAQSAQLASARRLFDRITSLSLSSKKMKFFFKKFLQFEKQEGGNEQERIEAVKTKAREYVAAKTADADE